MKPASEWTEEDILNLPVGEHDWFETKGRKTIDLTLSGVKEHEARQSLSREVSAFANTGGGVLVLGVPNQKLLTDIRQIDDGGISLTVRPPNTKEWLENWISTLVDPPLNNFNVYVVKREDATSKIGPDQGVFLVDIPPDSPDAPHQAVDNKYYIRTASRSVPARHQTVSDIFNRRSHPIFDVSFHLIDSKAYGVPAREISRLMATATNSGRVLAQYVSVFVDIPLAAATLVTAKDAINTLSLVTERGEEYVRNYKRNLHAETGGTRQVTTMYTPILPGLDFTWQIETNLPRNIWTIAELWELRVHWKVFADNSPPRTGSVKIADLRPARS